MVHNEHNLYFQSESHRDDSRAKGFSVLLSAESIHDFLLRTVVKALNAFQVGRRGIQCVYTMCLCVCICMYHMCLYNACVCMSVYMYVCECLYTCMCVHVCIRVCVNVCVHMFMCNVYVEHGCVLVLRTHMRSCSTLSSLCLRQGTLRSLNWLAREKK